MEPSPSHPPIPLAVEAVNAQWLTDALRWGGHDVVVTDAVQGGITGGNATKVRLRVTYDRPTDLPPDVFVKVGMELQDPTKNLTGSTYDIEGRYYLDVLPKLSTAIVPRCLAVIIDSEASRCALVLDDLVAAGGRFGSPLERELSVSEVAQLLEQLAELHGRWWGGDEAMPIPGLDHGISRTNRLGRYYSTFDREYLAGLIDGPRGAALPAAVADPDRLVAAFWNGADISLKDAPAVIHADPHLGNIFIRADGACGLADWQTLRWGRWSHDVAYLLGSALTVEDRRTAESELLATYLDALRSVTDQAPGEEAAKQAYRESMIYGLVGWLTAPPYFGYSEEYSSAYASKFAQAVVDHDTLGALVGA